MHLCFKNDKQVRVIILVLDNDAPKLYSWAQALLAYDPKLVIWDFFHLICVV